MGTEIEEEYNIEDEFETEETTEENPTKTKKKGNSSFKIVMLGAIIIVLGAGGVFIKGKIDELAGKKPASTTKIESNTTTKTPTPKTKPQVSSKEEQQEKIKRIIEKSKKTTAEEQKDAFAIPDEIIKQKQETQKREEQEALKMLEQRRPKKELDTGAKKPEKKTNGYFVPPSPEEMKIKHEAKTKTHPETALSKNKSEHSTYREETHKAMNSEGKQILKETKKNTPPKALQKEKRKDISLLPLPSEMKVKEERAIEDQAFGLEEITTSKSAKNGGVCRSSGDTLKKRKEYVFYVRQGDGYVPAYETDDWDGVGVTLDERIVSLSNDEENGLVEVEENKFLPVELFSSCSIFGK